MASLEELRLCMDAINDYCLEEFGTPANFANMHDVGLAYTTDPDTDDDIQVSIDLDNMAVYRYVNGEEVFSLYFHGYSGMYDWLSDSLVFDYLIEL